MRTQLNTFFKVINETVQQRGSRTDVTTLLDQASSVMKASNALNDDYEKQFQRQLNYVKSLADTKEIVDEYLRERIFPDYQLSVFEEEGSQFSEVQCVEPAPDDWIDDYKAGRRSALEWIAWIHLFKSLLHDSNCSSGEKLAILRRNLQGDCQDFVYGLGGGEPAYKEVLHHLKQDCGRRDVMRAAHMQAVEKLEAGRGALPKRYAERIRTHLFDLRRIGGSNSMDIIEKICSKLSVHDRLAWNDSKRSREETRTLEQFGEWLCFIATAYRTPYDVASDQQQQLQRESGRQMAQTNHVATNRPPYKCYKCQQGHRIDVCESFKSLSIKERINFVKLHHLCYGCLGPFHSAKVCRSSKISGVNNCKRRHHSLIHQEEPINPTSVETYTGNTACTQIASNHRVVFGVLRVNDRDQSGRLKTANLFYDEGSDTSLVREGFLRRLGFKGKPILFEISGVRAEISHCKSEQIPLYIELSYGGTACVNVASLPIVCDLKPLTNWADKKHNLAHLEDLPLEESGGRIDILLGLDHRHLVIPLDVRSGADNEPYAFKSKLGWIVRGVLGEADPKQSARINVISSRNITDLDTAIRKFADTESFGTEYKKDRMTPEDLAAIDIFT
ncbi:uncharacterized protein LOC124200515 [Daphnia pulex]|uniref:uncharacterized protein LOC124200515 n=1 Tax=Daphnia pulex TaxID=6669 RepID=UPI001EE14E9F|nr:uncharacterized protein LOC124200515 [Daphnia pulex]